MGGPGCRSKMTIELGRPIYAKTGEYVYSPARSRFAGCVRLAVRVRSVQTPVLGPPWTIPLEFPLDQWIVAGLTTFAGTPLDQTARFVSVMFFYLTLLPLGVLLSAVDMKRSLLPLGLAAFLLCPICIFWSRAFLIESTALFLTVSFLSKFAIIVARHQRLHFSHCLASEPAANQPDTSR
jgi:hypothetical protein